MPSRVFGSRSGYLLDQQHNSQSRPPGGIPHADQWNQPQTSPRTQPYRQRERQSRNNPGDHTACELCHRAAITLSRSIYDPECKGDRHRHGGRHRSDRFALPLDDGNQNDHRDRNGYWHNLMKLHVFLCCLSSNSGNSPVFLPPLSRHPIVSITCKEHAPPGTPTGIVQQ